MTRDEFQDFMNSAELLLFQIVPYFKVDQMCFSRDDICNIQFKISHSDR